jgi:hypothetical protein
MEQSSEMTGKEAARQSRSSAVTATSIRLSISEAITSTNDSSKKCASSIATNVVPGAVKVGMERAEATGHARIDAPS